MTDAEQGEPEAVVIDSRIDPLTAVHNFGFLSVGMVSVLPLLWVFLLKDNSFGTGFKVASYVNLVFSTPYTLVYFIFLLLGQSRLFGSWLDTTMRFSVAGPWFFNFYAIYVMAYMGITDAAEGGVVNLAALVLYIGYSAAVMYAQYSWVPGVARYYIGVTAITEAAMTPTLNSQPPVSEEAPNMDDMSYLDEVQE